MSFLDVLHILSEAGNLLKVTELDPNNYLAYSRRLEERELQELSRRGRHRILAEETIDHASGPAHLGSLEAIPAGSTAAL